MTLPAATADHDDGEPPGLSDNPERYASSIRLQPGDPTARVTVTRRARRPSFRTRYFPDASRAEWSDWRWQLRHRVRTADALDRIIGLSRDEREALCTASLPVAVTPYYLSRIAADESGALRRTMVPTVAEHVRSSGEADDPLGEDHDSPVAGLVHRYPDRVLLLATDMCAAYCRYCTRSRRVGDGHAAPGLAPAVDYIRRHTEIRDVIVSGGDPLTLSDERLDALLSAIRAIPHVEIIRIGTKVPAVLPMRVTAGLIRVLRRMHPLYMSIHATHPAELSGEMVRACGQLADAGIPLGSQTVLLRGVNDDVSTMTELMHRLLRARVRPYYLYQCDPISGSAHFRTPVARGLELIEGMRGHTSGYAIPTYVIDAPGGGGKVPVYPATIAGRDGDDLLLTNWRGATYRYPDALEGGREEASECASRRECAASETGWR